MSEDSSRQRQGQGKRFRRSRKDGHDRSYICRLCSKSYLSNPALYTHIKTKHKNGFIEEQNQNKQSVVNNQQNEVAVVAENDDLEEKMKVVLGPLQQLRNFMKKYFPQRNKGSSIRLLMENLPQDIQEYISPLLYSWEQRVNQNDPSTYSKPKISIDNVIGIFLTLMNSRVSSTCMNFFIRVFYYIREGIKIENHRTGYCETETAMNLPKDFNNLIMNKRIPPQDVEEDQLINNPFIVCKIIEQFGNWLYQQRYTDYKTIARYNSS